jgi:mercuric ion binding protein
MQDLDIVSKEKQLKNKIMKKYLLILTSIFTFCSLNAQEVSKSKKSETIVIQTSAQCGDCKERIENGLNYTKGVVFAELNDDTKKVTVKYKTGVTSPQKIKAKIAEIGYDADEIKATKSGLDKLPTCCKPGGMK